MKRFAKILGVTICMTFFAGMALGSGTPTDSTKDSNDTVNTVDTVDTSDSSSTDGTTESTSTYVSDTDWLKYYEDNNIEVIAVDANVLYEYGAYYTNQTICTAITVSGHYTGQLKANTDNNESFFFSIVADFEEKDECASIESDEVVVIAGVVEEPSSIGSTVNLKDCHVISTGDDAKATLQEYENQRDAHTEYANSLKETAEAAAEQQAIADKEAYKSNCVDVDYNDVARNPDNYDGKYIKITGKVIQVAEGWFDSVTLRVESSGGNVWYVTYYRSEGESRILENDNVTVYGKSTGVTSYTSVLGSSITIPSVSAEIIELN